MASSELSQVFKMPLLVSHYQAHHKLDSKVTFLVFLRMHYFNGDEHDSDYDTDMQLPFKTNAYTIIANLNYSLPAFIQHFALSVSTRELPVNYPKFFRVWIPSVHLNDIFQPPRIS